MRAVQVTAPRKIEMIDLPKPAMQKGRILVRTAMVSICGSDWPQVLGHHPEVVGRAHAGPLSLVQRCKNARRRVHRIRVELS